MKEECAFCNGSKVELVDGLGVPCVWCDPVGTAIADDKLERDGVTAAPVAAPVPPAGDVEVLPDRYDESQYRGTSLLAVRRWNKCLDAVTPLFTRLTAERDGLRADMKVMTAARNSLRLQVNELEFSQRSLNELTDDLQSELTKARELLKEVGKSPWLYDVLGSVREYNAHQSAPAAKGGV